MKLNDLKNKKAPKELPLGTHEVEFDKIQYRTDSNDEINGIFVHIKGFKSLYLPFFEEDNFQLDLLLNQLGVESYLPKDINEKSGTKIIVTRYLTEDRQYTNNSFNPNAKREDDLA